VFGSGVLDVAIGVAFVYLLLSLICSAVTEGIARIFAMRSSNLKDGIRNLLDDQGEVGYVQALYEHPLISGLYRQGWFDRLVRRDGKPSYIPSRTFALALGYNFDEALFKAICQSICMVVVYSPKYEDHVYCLREYTAMERIEMKRKEILGNKASNEVGMIIPIVLRGLQEGLPDKIRKQRHYVDFSKFSTASMNMK
jgi:hypothetical protein